MSRESTQFKPGNKAAAKSPKVVFRKFKEMYLNAQIDNEILSYEDACASIGWRDSKCNYWSNKITVFATLKNDIQAAIRRRINKGALNNDFNPTASIWRMKQLGEKDEKVVDNKSSDGSMTPKDNVNYSNVSTETLKKFLDEANGNKH